MEFPTRHQTHIQETASFRSLLRCLPAHWIVRHATERDYGIDCLVEPVDLPGGSVRGDLLAIQLKGVEKLSWPVDTKTPRQVRFSGIDVKTVNYWMGLPVPVFLCVAEASSGSVFFASVRHQVRRRYAECEGQQSFGFDLHSYQDLGATHGVDLFRVLYEREQYFQRFSGALTDLLANRDSYMEFIEEHIGRDPFLEVDTRDVITVFRLFFNVQAVCSFAGSDRHLPLLIGLLAEDRLAYPESWAVLHEQTRTRLLRELAPAFAEALRIGHRLITDIELAFWESTEPLLVRYTSEMQTAWMADIDRRAAQCL